MIEIILDKRQIWAICLFESRMSCKAAETTQNINNSFGPGIANECTEQWWFKKFCKGDKSLDDDECNDWPLEVDNGQLRIIKADPQRTRWRRDRCKWSTSLSTDTSGIHLQTQKCMQNTSWEQTRVPAQWKRIYRTMQNSVGWRN